MSRLMKTLALACTLWIATAWLPVHAQTPPPVAPPGVVASLDKTRLSLGEPVVLTLRRPLASQAVGTPGLDALDLSALRADFDIAARSVGRDARQEDLRLTLYPMRAGILGVPFTAARGQPLTLQVDDGPAADVPDSEAAPRVRLRVSSEPDSTAGWVVRQPVRVTLEACFTGQLLWQPPELASRNGLSVRLLGESSASGSIDGQPCTAQRWQWAVVPQVAGPWRLSWPLLQATRFGSEWRFPAPAVEAMARDLPGWLPGELPLRAPQVVSQHLPAEAHVNQPLVWELEIEGDYGDSTLAELLRAQLADDPLWSTHRPEVRPAPGRSLSPRWSLRLLAQPNETGALQPPMLHLPWVDPLAGGPAQVLQHVEVKAEAVSISDPQAGALLRWVVGALLAGATVAASVFGSWRLLRAWRLQRRAASERAQLLQAIERCDGPEDLQQALHRLAWGEGVARGATLPEVLARLQTHWRGPSLADWAQRFERQRFGTGADAAPGFDALRQELLHLAGALRPR